MAKLSYSQLLLDIRRIIREEIGLLSVPKTEQRKPVIQQPVTKQVQQKQSRPIQQPQQKLKEVRKPTPQVRVKGSDPKMANALARALAATPSIDEVESRYQQEMPSPQQLGVNKKQYTEAFDPFGQSKFFMSDSDSHFSQGGNRQPQQPVYEEEEEQFHEDEYEGGDPYNELPIY